MKRKQVQLQLSFPLNKKLKVYNHCVPQKFYLPDELWLLIIAFYRDKYEQIDDFELRTILASLSKLIFVNIQLYELCKKEILRRHKVFQPKAVMRFMGGFYILYDNKVKLARYPPCTYIVLGYDAALTCKDKSWSKDTSKSEILYL